MAWTLLIIAGIFEIIWAIGMKYSQGWTKLWPSLGTVAAMLVSFTLLSMAMKQLDAGVAYAVWTGIGAVGVAILGMMLFGEAFTLPRVLCIALIVAGIIGLKFTS